MRKNEESRAAQYRELAMEAWNMAAKAASHKIRTEFEILADVWLKLAAETEKPR
jgi:hypothetical protein